MLLYPTVCPLILGYFEMGERAGFKSPRSNSALAWNEQTSSPNNAPLVNINESIREGIRPNLERQRSRLNLLDLRFFIITMALRNIRISTSLWNRVKMTGMT